MTYTEKRVEEFRKVFPNKLGEVIDDFGSTVKSDIESFMTTKIAQAVAEERERMREEIKKPLEIVADFVERWNKQDKEKEVAQAIETLLSIKSKNIWN